MKLEWKRFYKGRFPYLVPFLEIRKNKFLYILKKGNVNIYKSDEYPEQSLPSSDDLPIDSILTEEKITAFDVSEDGKIIITGGKDGIRKWKWVENKQGKKTFD